MRAPRRLVTGIAVTALLAGAALAGATPAGAAALPIQQCTTSSGVVLAVDFGHWGGPIVRACGSTPTTGYTLLNQGGWRSTGTQTDGPGFICRISYSGYQGGAGFPSPSVEACGHTPPTTAYWLYWHANPGDSGWTFSQDGAANYSPRPGSVDLWTFGSSSSTPRVSPDAVRAHNSSPGAPSSAPAPHSSAPAGGSPSPVAGGGAGGGGSGGAPASQPAFGPAPATAGSTTGTSAGRKHATARAASPASRSASTTPAQASGGASAAGTPTIVNAPPAAAARHSSGSAVPGLVTAGLVFALGSIAAWAGWRRRLGR
jgi:hypothetical protein